MNRGHGGEEIFEGIKNKVKFLDFPEDLSERLKIRIFSYYITNNHFHMILENSIEKLSDLMKRLNGLYGMYCCITERNVKVLNKKLLELTKTKGGIKNESF